jgi:DNA adenine methylase
MKCPVRADNNDYVNLSVIDHSPTVTIRLSPTRNDHHVMTQRDHGGRVEHLHAPAPEDPQDEPAQEGPVVAQPLTPPIGYYGSKGRIAPRIVAMLPEHRGYVEPFAGSLSVLLAKPQSPFEVVNDLDGDLMTFWRVLRDQPDELVRVCSLTPHSRAELAQAWPIPDDVTDVERARRVWVKLAQGRGGQLRPSGWRYHQNPNGRAASMPRTLAGYVAKMLDLAERIREVTLESLPGLEVIDRYGQDPGNLLYVDPPYLFDVRSKTGMYRHELGRHEQHRELAAQLEACRAAVVVSGYPHPLYEELYAGWDRAELRAGTGQANANGWQERTEVLWSNRALRRDAQLALGGEWA